MEGYCGVEKIDLKQALYWLKKANEQSGGRYAHEIVQIREGMRNECLFVRSFVRLLASRFIWFPPVWTSL